MSKDKPNFYAVIPASVRYDSELSSSEKLFYAEITAMSQKEGYCWASNSYFAELYDVKPPTVSMWVKSLKEKDHVIVEYEREGKQIKGRKIYPIQKIEIPYSENRKGGSQKIERGYSENRKENNTSKNNIPSLSDVKNYFRENGYDPDIGEKAFKYYNVSIEENPNLQYWRDSKGNMVRSWKQKMRAVWFKDENKLKEDDKFNPEIAKMRKNAFK